MTSKLKCPICGKDLMQMTLSSNDDSTLYSSVVAFPTKDCICNTSASKKIWAALIQAKQELEITLNALQEIRQKGLDISATPFAMGFIADKALEQIRQGNYRANSKK